MRTSRSISFSSVRNATREPHAFYRTFLFFQSLHSVKRHAREYIYIYIYGSEEVRFRNVRVEGNDVERKRFTLLPLRSREEALTLNFGGVDFRIDLARGPGSIDRFRMAGSFGRDPPRRNSCRGSSDSGGPRRAEWSELSSAIFSLEPRARVRLFSRDRHVPNAPCCFPQSALRFVNSSRGILYGGRNIE